MARYSITIPCGDDDLRALSSLRIEQNSCVTLPRMNKVFFFIQISDIPVDTSLLGSPESLAQQLAAISRAILVAKESKEDLSISIRFAPMVPINLAGLAVKSQFALSPFSDHAVNLFRLCVFDKELKDKPLVSEVHYMRDARDLIASSEASFTLSLLNRTTAAISPKTIAAVKEALSIGADVESAFRSDKVITDVGSTLMDLSVLKTGSLITSIDTTKLTDSMTEFCLVRMAQVRVLSKFIPHPLVKAAVSLAIEMAIMFSRKTALEAINRPISDESRSLYSAGSRAIKMIRYIKGGTKKQ